MSFFKSLLEALPNAATSPYAFVAYICVVVAWVVIGLRVKRNAQLLAHLERLPSGDRLAALQLEMGAASIKGGITPEQWIRAQVHKYLFLGFAILCLAAVVVFVVAYSVRRPGTADVDITPYSDSQGHPVSPDLNTTSSFDVNATSPSAAAVSFQKGGSDDPVNNQFDATSGDSIHGSADFTLTYQYDRRNGKIEITPSMPYLSSLSEGGPIRGVPYWWSAFGWQFPKLSIKVVNNTDRTLELTEAAIAVKDSKINTDPVILIHEDLNNVGHFEIVNEGWGKVLKPSFRLGIASRSACDAFPTKEPTEFISRDTFDGGDNVPIASFVPIGLRGERVVCVFGTMQFATESGAQKSLKIYTLASLVQPGPGAPRPPDYLYDVFLKAGEAGYSKRIPISEAVKPGDVEHFLIRIGTDKSASFDLAFSFTAKPTTLKQSTAVGISIFVPRSQVRRSCKARRGKDCVSPW
jgi:hypothetical protein